MFAPLPEPLPEEILTLAARLPRKPTPVTLSGKRIRLEPYLPERDRDRLHSVSSGEAVTIGGRSLDAYDSEERIWRYMYAGPFASAREFGEYMQRQVDAPDGLPLTVFDRELEFPVGIVNIMANHPEHLKVELGSIWYSPLAQGQGFNTEATYLLLEYLFGLGYRRVEWKCNRLNERSRRAALKLGFRYEGTQECHYIFKGRSRDTDWFRILDREWPEIRQNAPAEI